MARPQTLSAFTPQIAPAVAALSSSTLERIRIRIPNIALCSAILSILALVLAFYAITYQQILKSKLEHQAFELGMYKSQIQSVTSEDHSLRIQSMDVRLDRIDHTLSEILQEHPNGEGEQIPPPQKRHKSDPQSH